MRESLVRVTATDRVQLTCGVFIVCSLHVVYAADTESTAWKAAESPEALQVDTNALTFSLWTALHVSAS